VADRLKVKHKVRCVNDVISFLLSVTEDMSTYQYTKCACFWEYLVPFTRFWGVFTSVSEYNIMHILHSVNSVMPVVKLITPVVNENQLC
jgi:hypothetical protein